MESDRLEFKILPSGLHAFLFPPYCSFLACSICICVSGAGSIFYLTFLFWPCQRQDVGSQFPNQGSNPWPQHWEHGVLSTGLPGNSHSEWLTIAISWGLCEDNKGVYSTQCSVQHKDSAVISTVSQKTLIKESLFFSMWSIQSDDVGK